jgi:hypothetical protein
MEPDNLNNKWLRILKWLSSLYEVKVGINIIIIKRGIINSEIKISIEAALTNYLKRRDLWEIMFWIDTNIWGGYI